MVSRLICTALLLLLAAASYYVYGARWSGRLALSQPAASTELPRGVDFGPVWLEQGKPVRFFISALVPETEAAPWHSRFEILDEQKRPVLRQDELRFIGAYQFQPGEQAVYSGTFALSRETGYYYFRFQARNGEYPIDLQGPPAVEFALRQGVLAGYYLWVPPAALALLSVILLWIAGIQVSRLGRQLPEGAELIPLPPGQWQRAARHS
jgi:hypothetical protein